MQSNKPTSNIAANLAKLNEKIVSVSALIERFFHYGSANITEDYKIMIRNYEQLVKLWEETIENFSNKITEFTFLQLDELKSMMLKIKMLHYRIYKINPIGSSGDLQKLLRNEKIDFNELLVRLNKSNELVSLWESYNAAREVYEKIKQKGIEASQEAYYVSCLKAYVGSLIQLCSYVQDQYKINILSNEIMHLKEIIIKEIEDAIDTMQSNPPGRLVTDAHYGNTTYTYTNYYLLLKEDLALLAALDEITPQQKNDTFIKSSYLWLSREYARCANEIKHWVDPALSTHFGVKDSAGFLQESERLAKLAETFSQAKETVEEEEKTKEKMDDQVAQVTTEADPEIETQRLVVEINKEFNRFAILSKFDMTSADAFLDLLGCLGKIRSLADNEHLMNDPRACKLLFQTCQYCDQISALLINSTKQSLSFDMKKQLECSSYFSRYEGSRLDYNNKALSVAGFYTNLGSAYYKKCTQMEEILESSGTSAEAFPTQVPAQQSTSSNSPALVGTATAGLFAPSNPQQATKKDIEVQKAVQKPQAGTVVSKLFPPKSANYSSNEKDDDDDFGFEL